MKINNCLFCPTDRAWFCSWQAHGPEEDGGTFAHAEELKGVESIISGSSFLQARWWYQFVRARKVRMGSATDKAFVFNPFNPEPFPINTNEKKTIKQSHDLKHLLEMTTS